jgi:GTP-binding protein
MNAFSVGGQDEQGKNRLVIVDMPGYGKGGRAEWGTEILKYLEKRKELRRAFLLIEAEHGIKDNDRQLLLMLKDHDVPFEIVLAKADKILLPGSRTPALKTLEGRFSILREKMEAIRATVMDLELDSGKIGEVIACSSDKRVDGKTLGIDNIRFAMLSAAGLEQKASSALTQEDEIVPYEDIVFKA